MKFLNKKEQVLDIELTEYGKRLLSKGRFKPSYYAFFDDGILYDSEYGGVVETQNDTQPRIIKNTPQLEAQSIFNGIESRITRANDYVRGRLPVGDAAPDPGVLELIDQGEDFQNSTDKLFSLTYPLGTSELTNDSLPAWKVNFLRGLATGSLDILNAVTCSNQIMNIPQIEVAPITYETRVDTLTEEQKFEFSPTELYGDETITVLERDSAILLQIKEENTEFEPENFEIEVYEIQSVIDTQITNCADGKYIEEMIPLYFKKSKSNIENGILLDTDEQQEIFENPNLMLDSSYVEYFFDIAVDNEIDNDIICKFTKNEGEGLFSQKVLDCEPEKVKRKMSAKNLFDTDVDSEDCIE